MTDPRPAPVSTYRVQVRAAFDLHSVAELTDYLADLGADWVYLSPLLEAEPGSDHGYDVISHERVDPARGGDEGLVEAANAAHGKGLGVLVDIVPNHMGVATPAKNAWWWDVLTHGRDSRYADAFDVDWDFGGGRLRIPVLGSADDVDALKIEGDELVYYDNRYPIAPGTADDGADARTVHERQHYELVDWRRADYDLNYRRFFAVNTLAGIRVELPEVFDASHRTIVSWIRDGLVDGLRIDHPDGLADPKRYLDDLAEATAGRYVLVEKILEGDEPLPEDWATAGTTGYDALGDVDRVLIDPAGEEPLTALAARLGGPTDWKALIHDTKREVADGILRSEVLRLVRTAADLTDGWAPSAGSDASRSDGAAVRGDDPERLADAVGELLTCFPVYRSYLPRGVEQLDAAVEDAKRHRPDLAAELDVASRLLRDPSTAVAQRFQQTSGMVMAKGVEDSAFYRFTRLGSLTEVGGEPDDFAETVERFHERQARRQADWPGAMTTLSTHDTKRGEDVRARIDVLSETPEEWAETLDALERLVGFGDPTFANLLWQATVGAWPIERDRLQAYAEKASKEAGVSTTWTAPDEAFGKRLTAAVDAVYDDETVATLIERVSAGLDAPGWSNGLSMKLLQLAAPGVPDVYQGSELWEQSLVDPDNRRPVDFALRRELLAEIDQGALPALDEVGAAKLLVVAKTLRLKRDRPELFTGYTPLTASGEAADHLVAFDRGGAIALATRLPVGLAERGGWGDTVVDVGSAPVVDVFTDREYQGGELRVADLLEHYPVALLVEVGGKP
ncbi:malto-oligosyltrehalose synthase [Amnibacterium setariae]|uniref:Malto-oligosyltrehalose synthase n=1 Tax=Amnibacterium setariae TaxID=2306585 RepID=A0A3A1U5T0_9MICO|nr:malto-oligosyltrehalose synthase [Amnibacterium setariae]RIX28294.1 malto-oligosyltrehalose synthase [Amnibacterium setariae]